MSNLKIKESVHPIFSQSDFTFQTPMIIELENKLHEWIWNGATGGLVLGAYRIGKKKAFESISSRLKNRLNESIPVKRLTIKRRDVSTIASIFKNLCYALDIPVKNKATSDEMSNDIIHCFADLSLKNSTHQIVLVVDEMQRLNIKQIEAFAELYDVLSDIKISLIVIFVGNLNSSKSLIEQIKSDYNELIRGRFFTQYYRFYGLKNHDNTYKCLLTYDSNIENRTSITEYFLEKDYREGFRLADLSHQIWGIYENEYAKNLKIESWPMQYFVSMIKTLIVDYLPTYGVKNSYEMDEMIRKSIDASGLKPNLITLN